MPKRPRATPGSAGAAAGVAATADIVLEMERAALDRWGRGDPSGFLEICADDVTYFDPFLERRVDGLVELTRYYESLRGRVQVDRYELLNPQVADLGDAAVLTFNYVSWTDDVEHRWNCTEVYRRTRAGWRIVHTHWSPTRPEPEATL
jgi:ketosteroid isomerase-like protein